MLARVKLFSYPVIQVNIANDHCIRRNPGVWSNDRHLRHDTNNTAGQSLAFDELQLGASLTRLPSVISCRCRQYGSSSMCTGNSAALLPVVNILK